MTQLLNEVRFAARSLAKSPGPSFLMIVTLAAGLAANATIFNILDAMVVRGFEFAHSDRLVRIWETSREFEGIDRDNVSPANLLDWQEQGRGALADLFAISYWEAGRDMSLSHDLYWSFIRYQTMIKREFEVMAKRHSFIELDGEASVSAVNKLLRQRIGEHLGIRSSKYTPSSALAHLWR